MTGRATSDEKDFLMKSLADLDSERAVGDISEADYQRLRARYTRRAAEILAPAAGEPGPGEIRSSPGIDAAVLGDAAEAHRADPDPGSVAVDEAGDIAEAHIAETHIVEAHIAEPEVPGTSPKKAGRRPRRWLLVGAIVSIVSGIALLVVSLAVINRGPAGPLTGSSNVSNSAEASAWLEQAEAANSADDLAQALSMYQRVLSVEPDQPEALTQAGWIEFSAGVLHSQKALIENGQKLEEQAVREVPGAWSAHLYLGSMQLTEGDYKDAADQFRSFIEDDPPVADLQEAESTMATVFQRAGEPMPQLPSGVSTGTTTSPTTTSSR